MKECDIFRVPDFGSAQPIKTLLKNTGKKLTANIAMQNYYLGLPSGLSETFGNSLLVVELRRNSEKEYFVDFINIPKSGLIKENGENLKINYRGEFIFLAFKDALSNFLIQTEPESLIIPINTGDNCSWAPALTCDHSRISNKSLNPLIPTEYDARLKLAYHRDGNEIINFAADSKNINAIREMHSRAWKNKEQMLFWRGGCNGEKNFYSDYGQWMNSREYICAQNASSIHTNMKITRNIGNSVKSVRDKIDIYGAEVSNSEYGLFKYFPDLNGSVRAWGTIMRHLQGMLVLREKRQSKSLAFDNYMTPWVEYVPVENNFANVGEVLEWCLEHDKDCMEIALNGYLSAIKYIKYCDHGFQKALEDFSAKNLDKINLFNFSLQREFMGIDKLLKLG